MSTYARGTRDYLASPDYAQHLTTAAAAWLAEHHDPKWKPKTVRRSTLKPRRLTPAQREKAIRESFGLYGTPEQEARFRAEIERCDA